jgi:ribose transport system permease protein
MSQVRSEDVGQISTSRPADREEGAAVNVPERASVRPRWGNVVGLLRSGVVLGTFVAMIVAFGVLKEHSFLTTATLDNILDQSVVPALLASGLTLVLASGEFDLSFGATLSLGAGFVVVLMVNDGANPALAIVLTLVGSAVAGLVIGVVVAYGRASAFIVTLAFSSVFAGLEIGLTGNKTIYEGVPASFTQISADTFLGRKYPVWLAVIVIVVVGVLLHGTRFGRHVQAIGENESAAYIAGVRVARLKIIAFAVLALLAGLSSLVLTSRASSYYPGSAGTYMLNTYAAVFLGVAANRHGRFSVGGSMLGVLWLVTLQSGLAQVNVASWLTNLVEGLVLGLAVLIARSPHSRARA